MRLAFITDIVTPYTIAVMSELTELVQLVVIFADWTSARGAGWSFPDLPFPHVVVGGLAIKRPDPDRSDYYLDPRILLELRRHRPSVTISAGWSIPTWYAALNARLTATPLVIQSDGTPLTERTLSSLQRRSRRLLVARAAGFAANSRAAARRFIELGAPPDRVHLAPHSTNLAPFWEVARHRAYRRDGALRLMMAGRLVARKGFFAALAGLALAQSRQPDIAVSIVGTGPEEGRLRHRAAELGVSVDFLGFVEQPDLGGICAEADVFLFPSLQDEFGFVLLEAMAAGLACIASPFAGATEDLVQDGATGLVAAPDDTERLASAVLALARDRGLVQRLGRAAHQATLERSPRVTAEGYLAAATAVQAISASRRSSSRTSG